MTNDEARWWRGLPPWLKLLTLIVAFPAWLVIIVEIFRGQPDSNIALIAFVVLIACALLHLIFDRRPRGGGEGGGGDADFDCGGGDSGGGGD